MKYLLLVFLAISSLLPARGIEVDYMYYSDPHQVMDSYDLKDCYKTCKKGYEHTGDVYSPGDTRCWCERWKVVKLRILNELHDAGGKPYWIVSKDCYYAWIVYGGDDHIVKFETEVEK